MPTCPKCGRPMVGGAPHGDWPIQFECRPCNVFVTQSVMADGTLSPPTQR
jgi:hypothetical protein